MQHLSEQWHSTPIVVIHPHYRRPLQLLSGIVNSYEVLQIRMQVGDTVEQVSQEIDDAMIEPEVIVVQDLDFIAPQDQLQLLHLLAKHNSRTVIFTRDVQREWFQDAILRGSMTLYDDLDELGIGYRGQPRLDVFAFGQGEVYWNGRRITEWEGELPKSLFFFLVHRRVVSRDEILQYVWPGAEHKAALNAFHVMKTRLRIMLGEDIFRYENGLYRISPAVTLHYDVQQFYELQQEVTGESPAECAQRLRNAFRLARQGFLMGMEQPWVREPREVLCHHRNALLSKLGEISEETKDYNAAIGFMQRVLPIRSRQPEHLLHVLGLYQQIGRPCDGLAYAERILRNYPEGRHQWLMVMRVVNELRRQCR